MYGKLKFFGKRPSDIHPILYDMRVWQRRIFKFIDWQFNQKKYSQKFNKERLEYRYFKHSSKLIKKLGNSDIQLQINKVQNLKLAIAKINGITIYPGEIFSFCKLVGLPRKSDGYLPGMELSRGKVREGIGGGICQISNLIHWMALHTPLQVIARSNHSFDPFPDSGRILPFGSGAAIFYNFIDLEIANRTEDCFQILLWLTDKALEGEIRTNRSPELKYHVFEKNHGFHIFQDKKYRKNEIWRDVFLRNSINILKSEFLYANNAEVKY